MDSHDISDNDEVSRSQQRREALAVLDLADQLIGLSKTQLAALPLSDPLRDAIAEGQRITKHVARKRQTQYLAKLLRREEDTVDALRQAMEPDRAAQRRETATLHLIEQWRTRLIDSGDDALGDLIDRYPQADRQRLRSLVRQARVEKLENRPPRAFREIFQELRPLLEQHDDEADDEQTDAD